VLRLITTLAEPSPGSIQDRDRDRPYGSSDARVALATVPVDALVARQEEAGD
jgi:hypothetical protein